MGQKSFFKLAAAAAATLTFFAASTPVEASGIFYGYGRLNAQYEWYHGARDEGSGITVHEFSFIDSSGSFRAAMETEGNRLAAQGEARAEEERKQRNYESFGGRDVTYQYERAQAREGDGKRYILRLGSDEGLNATSITGGDPDEHLLAYGEIGMSAQLWNDMLVDSDAMALRHGVGLEVRWGSFKHYDRPGDEQIETKRDGGYFYIPVTYQLAMITPLGIGVIGEAGIDPITAARIYTGNNELKHDKVYRAMIEYRYEGFSGGFRLENYYGCFTKSEGKAVPNPEYKHQMMGVYIAAGM